MIPGSDRMRMKRSVGGPLDVAPQKLSAGPLDIGPRRSLAPKPAGPPNLRDAEDEDTSCGNCAHFDGRCTKFDYDCSEEQVCDSFEAAGDQDDEQLEARGDQASDPYEMES